MTITNKSIDSYMDTLEPGRRKDIQILVDLMSDVTKEKPVMWGSIIGFGNLHYTYKTGTEGDMPLLGLSSRKQAMTLYLSYDLEKFDLLNSLGKHKIGKSCLYINKLDDIDLDVLKSLLIQSSNKTLNSSFIKVNS